MAKIGRNDPCPCGSGKKYKNCCLADDAPATQARNAIPESALVHVATAKQCAAFGRLDEAIAAFHAALSVAPAFAEAHNDLGLAYQAKGQLDAAIGSYEAALSNNPDLAPACFNLGRALQLQGRHGAAAEAYQRFIGFHADHFQAYHNLGIALEALGHSAGAVAAYSRAFELKPTFFPALFGKIRTLTKVVPLWHVPMMNDAARNDAYFAGLRAAITPRSRVFEIGTGSGLLALMAAGLGAEQVTTCEAEPLIADTAKQVIAANGYERKVQVLSKRSTEVALQDDLPERADILVQEVFSSNLLSEGVLPSIEDAKRRLLTADCRMVPASASLMIALFGGDEIGGNLLVENAHGFDLRAFNTIVPRVRNIHRRDLQIEFLSDAVEAFRFDFQKDSAWQPEEKTLQVPVTGDGRCLGIVQWIRLYFGEETVFENHPKIKTATSGWSICAYLNVSPAAVARGQTAAVFATHDRTQPWFELRNVG